MKKVGLMALLSMFLASSVLHAQEWKQDEHGWYLEDWDSDAEVAPEPKNAVTLNPIALIFGVFGIELEHALFKSGSVFAMPNFTTLGDENSRIWSFGVDAGYRHYFLGTAPAGLWLGGITGVGYAVGTGWLEGVSGVMGGVGGMLGYTWIFSDIFVLSIGGGGLLVFGDVSTGSGREETVVNFQPGIRISMGAAF